jgi:CRP-like cAMP-binding protein
MSANEQLFRDVPLLAKLAEEDLRALAGQGRANAHRSGAVIFREGDPGDSLHIVVEGAVRIVVLSPEGVEATVALLGPGEFVGHLALIDGRPRSASAIASGATKTLVVTRDDFLAWLSQRPTATLALLEAMSVLLRRTDEILTDLAFLPLQQRLAKRLLDLSETRADGRSGRIRITQSELASMLGVSRESVNKQLNAWARAGWLRLGRGSVTLLNAESLRDLQ